MPPTPSRDLLLKRDAVTTLQRRVYAQRLAASGGEATELPPVALSAPLVLSPAERHAIVADLDAALGSGDLVRYRRLAEVLYTRGLISAGDLGSCLAAAAVAAGGVMAPQAAGAAAPAVAASPGECARLCTEP